MGVCTTARVSWWKPTCLQPIPVWLQSVTLSRSLQIIIYIRRQIPNMLQTLSNSCVPECNLSATRLCAVRHLTGCILVTFLRFWLDFSEIHHKLHVNANLTSLNCRLTPSYCSLNAPNSQDRGHLTVRGSGAAPSILKVVKVAALLKTHISEAAPH